MTSQFGYRASKVAPAQWAVYSPDNSVVGWFDNEALAIAVAEATERATGDCGDAEGGDAGQS